MRPAEARTVEIANRVEFLTFGLVANLLAKHCPHGLGVEPLPFRLGEQFLQVVGDRLLLFFEPLPALEE